ncbi:hypothetical protein HAN_3g486 (nucleomorph) [Hemiselmis andersenii]|uniref:Photolyase/cryptochrome alpha/beta domain-containing protein n=2 Tax=Hemiselmis andersenii TaxID=464988 RepID=A9BLA5_HEMAN|nr:hypothetical protein HAN_3g486 [Hemiselmis andersenii]ABW98288.1 hypothetical protein HAN_3g486 [Hemiselmis andersenii]
MVFDKKRFSIFFKASSEAPFFKNIFSLKKRERNKTYSKRLNVKKNSFFNNFKNKAMDKKNFFIYFKKKKIFWFRFNFDFFNNSFLKDLIAKEIDPILLLCFDSRVTFFFSEKRKKFLLLWVKNLKIFLEKKKLSLLYLHGHPEKVIPELTLNFFCNEIYFPTESNFHWKKTKKKEKKLIISLKNSGLFVKKYEIFHTFNPKNLKKKSYKGKTNFFSFSKYFRKEKNLKLFFCDQDLKKVFFNFFSEEKFLENWHLEKDLDRNLVWFFNKFNFKPKNLGNKIFLDNLFFLSFQKFLKNFKPLLDFGFFFNFYEIFSFKIAFFFPTIFFNSLFKDFLLFRRNFRN